MASASSSAQAAFGLGRRKKNPGVLDQIGKFFGGDKKRKSKVRKQGESRRETRTLLMYFSSFCWFTPRAYFWFFHRSCKNLLQHICHIDLCWFYCCFFWWTKVWHCPMIFLKWLIGYKSSLDNDLGGVCFILNVLLQRGCDFKSFLFFSYLNGTDISSIFSSSVTFNMSVVDVIWWTCSSAVICQTGVKNSCVSVQVLP